MGSVILQGLALGVYLAISVGPVLFAVIKQSIINGRKGGMSFIAGISASDIVLVLITNLATSAFEVIIDYKRAIGIVGSILILVIGTYFLFFKKVPKDFSPDVPVELNKGHYFKIFLAGFFLNILNPFLLIIWFANATLVLNYSGFEKIVLFSTTLIFVFLTDYVKVLFANRIREKLTANTMVKINRISGAIFMGFGIFLFVAFVFFPQQFLNK
jgi:threonine/homoserine/homoserine lactone efflux protein